MLVVMGYAVIRKCCRSASGRRLPSSLKVMRLMTDSGIVQSTPRPILETSQKRAIPYLGGHQRIQMGRQVESRMQDMFNKSSIPDSYKQITITTL